MFPNDDICDVNAAKDAARRLFSRYKIGESGSGMGKEEVSRLMKATYQAINMRKQQSKQHTSLTNRTYFHSSMCLIPNKQATFSCRMQRVWLSNTYVEKIQWVAKFNYLVLKSKVNKLKAHHRKSLKHRLNNKSYDSRLRKKKSKKFLIRYNPNSA